MARIPITPRASCLLEKVVGAIFALMGGVFVDWVGEIIPDAEVMPEDVDVPEVVGAESGLFVWENSVFWLLVKISSLLDAPSGVCCVFLILISPSPASPVIFLSSLKSIPLAPMNAEMKGLLRNFSALCMFC